MIRGTGSSRARPLPEQVSASRRRTRLEQDRTRLPGRGRHGEIAHKGEKAPNQASPRWHVERTKA